MSEVEVFEDFHGVLMICFDRGREFPSFAVFFFFRCKNTPSANEVKHR